MRIRDIASDQGTLHNQSKVRHTVTLTDHAQRTVRFNLSELNVFQVVNTLRTKVSNQAHRIKNHICLLEALNIDITIRNDRHALLTHRHMQKTNLRGRHVQQLNHAQRKHHVDDKVEQANLLAVQHATEHTTDDKVTDGINRGLVPRLRTVSQTQVHQKNDQANENL